MPENQFVECKTRQDLWDWLSKNHSQKTSVWLIYFKKSSGVGDLNYDKIVDTLLCWGWIDSLPRKVDENRSSIRISPRNPKSNWSKVNKDKVARLIEQNQIQPAGLTSIKTAQENGCWTALDDVENLICPLDMLEFMEQNDLVDKWEKQGRSYMRGFLEFLLNSKRAETRQKKFSELKSYLSSKTSNILG
jgi:uncharacterized protein YdeI (YjbR/CyaY-like superfamily)